MPDIDSAAGKAGKSAAEGLSQLVARILNQLAISAWLPSAALVLLLAFVTELGVVVQANPTNSWLVAVAAALSNLGGMQTGSFFLLAAAVVVLTMLTQAFTFEAIRLLEGYWGRRWPLRWVAQAMCWRHRHQLESLENSRLKQARRAWESAENRIRAEQQVRNELSSRMISALRRSVCRDGATIELTIAEKQTLAGYDWTIHADAEPLRRESVAAKRLTDYPRPNHILPTRLGNVLRRYEDDTGRTAIESVVEERFDALPFSLQLSHDELRGRLDLYCSLTLVWLLVAAVSVVRFVASDQTQYGWWLGGLCLGSALFSYRAAVSSARHYGPVLVRIASYPLPAEQQASPAELQEFEPVANSGGGRPRWWRRSSAQAGSRSR